VVTPEEPVRMRVVRPELERTKEPPAEVAQETAMVDMAQYIGDTSIAAVSGTIIRDTQIPHMVVHLPTHTWEVQFSKERMTVGRDVNCDIHIPDESVSRHHASIERHGEDYVIREAHSRNGLWLNQQRIEKRTLRDGDVISLGRAKLMFKGGFAADDLTLIGRPRAAGVPARRPVVFVPGLGGSELWLGSERLWPNPKILISNPEVYSLPGDPRIEARHIVSDVVIVPNIIKQQQYSRLGDYLETGLGYKRGRDLFEFAYDWRQDIRLAAQRLAETIERWGVKPPVTIIAHSLGTLVTRYYVERLGGKKVVERMVLMGGPHYGAPKALATILVGPGILPFGMGDERLRHVLATFPSAYQILPVYRCVTDQDDRYIDPLHDESWLPERQRPFLRAARSFRNELGVRSSVPCVSIFGYGLKTILRVKIHRRFDGQWEKVDFVEDTAGDLSVPSGSAVLKKSEIHPVLQEHGSLYVDDDVKMRLKVELTRSTTWEKGK
jgi:pimeloyl-ACP methyl ester carboxylesterase